MSIQVKRKKKLAPQQQITPKSRLWTRDEYYSLVAQNFFVDERVELIWGRIVEMPPMLNPHAAGISLSEDALRSAFGTGHWFRVQMPLDLSQASAPEPDIAVVIGGPRDYSDHPTTALLVVEVSWSSLDLDRDDKGPLYASAGLQEYWIVNLVDYQLEVYRDPKPDSTEPQKSRYGHLITLGPNDTVSPLAMPKKKIKVNDLLP